MNVISISLAAVFDEFLSGQFCFRVVNLVLFDEVRTTSILLSIVKVIPNESSIVFLVHHARENGNIMLSNM